MLGSLICTWRRRRSLSLEDLARAACVSRDLLWELEAEQIETIEHDALLRIADRLALPTAAAYAELCRANEPRRFSIYAVGPSKTGTTSMAGLFSGFRARHEWMATETWNALRDHDEGRASDVELRRFLRFRDIRGALELDSAGFHHLWIRLLVEELPKARFVLTLRDSRSWLESLIGYLLDDGEHGGDFTGWGRAQLGLPFDLPYRDRGSRARLEPILHEHLEPLLRYFRDANLAVLEAVPEDRLLVVPTGAISRSLDALADFAGVATSALDAARSHELRGRQRPEVLSRLSPDDRAGLFDGARSPVLDRYFRDAEPGTGNDAASAR